MNTYHIVLAIAVLSYWTPAKGQQDVLPAGSWIEVRPAVVDYDTIPQGSDGVRVFHVLNTGDAPLVITTIKTSHGGLVAKHSRNPIAPGDSAAVMLKYLTTRLGPLNAVATVESNAVNAPSKMVRVRAFVRVP